MSYTLKNEGNISFINIIDTIATNLNLSAYLYDFKTQEIIYVSPNSLFLCGYEVETVIKMGFCFFSKIMSPDDLFHFRQALDIAVSFLYKFPVEERKEFTIETFLTINNINGLKYKIDHKLLPLEFTNNGEIRLALCVVTLSLKHNKKPILLKCRKDNIQYYYNVAEKTWNKESPKSLTRQELIIVQLSAQGYTNEQIAKTLAININTVKFHKRLIFEKWDVANTTESITKAHILGIV
jgi:DNA-binding CsgD family transcriptional regulator